MTSYEMCKIAILKYQKENPNYKAYKKGYDIEYRNKNKAYGSFRVTKSAYYKKYGQSLGKVKLTAYLVKQATKGVDVLPFLDKI